ncbi:hypothetical protein [Streptomyces pseudovenezuelae]|nr:hypothetical protein [Streptomyces pseudovenezuelae]
MSHDCQRLRIDCVEGPEDVKPSFVVTDPADLPAAVPAALREPLTELGVSQRLANPWLWDAITTAILRQGVHPDRGRRLYRTWCSAYGTIVEGPFGPLTLAPDHTRVLDIQMNTFAVAGTRFHYNALTTAAAQYELHHKEWQHLNAAALAAALTNLPHLEPWTARVAAADFTGDFSIYPHDDLAVRSRAADIVATPGPTGKRTPSARCGPAGAVTTGPNCTPSPSPPSPGESTPDDIQDLNVACR